MEEGNTYVSTLAFIPTELSFPVRLYLNTDQGIVINGSAEVTSWDLDIIVNGALHPVSQVIELPTVVTFAAADPNLSILTEALIATEEAAGHLTTLETPWSTAPAPFTVFAPDNTAFEALLNNLGFNNLDGIAPTYLEKTLSYHVAPEVNIRTNFIASGTITTLGGPISITANNGAVITDGNNRTAKVILANIQTYNGVIHIIDNVLLPPEE